MAFEKWIFLIWAGMIGVGNANDDFVQAFAQRDLRRAESLALSETGDLKGVYLGGVKTMLGDFDGAHEAYEMARGQLHLEPVASGRLLVARAIVAFLNSRQYGDGAPVDALRLLTRAKDILGKDDLAIRMVETEIMGYSSKADHVQQAYVGYMQLLSLCQKTGDSLRVAHCAMRLGRIDGATGGHGGALQNFARAAHIFDVQKDGLMHAWAFRNMGQAHRKLGHYDVAQEHLEKALHLAQEADARPLTMRILNDLSRLAMEMEDETQAIVWEKEADVVLGHLQQKIQSGERMDSVMLDFYHLLKLRYASLLPYETDLYVGFYDQLIRIKN
jgi:tetratricopeptide (TPR) repeat protein